MNVHVILLMFLLIFSLALVCALCWPHHGPVQSRAEAKVRTTLPRLLKPRSPDDCPICRLASTPSSAGGPAPAPVRPWSEVKSRRGAPKRMNTEGFACPNRNVPVLRDHRCSLPRPGRGWQAWPCRADPDLSLSGLPHHLQLPDATLLCTV